MGRILFGLTLVTVMALGGFLIPQAPDQARNRRGTPLPYPTHVVTTPIVVPPTAIPPTKTPMWAPTKVPTIGPPIQATQAPTRTPNPVPTSRSVGSTQRPASPTPDVVYPTAVLTPDIATPSRTPVIPKSLPHTGEQR